MRIARCVLLTFAVFACLQPIRIARAEDSSASKTLVLIPYQEPTDTDPYGPKVTAMLVTALTAAGIKPIGVPPVDHLDAVANAAQICSENGAQGLLIPEGRYEVTGRLSYFIVASTVTYEWHVEFRLDLVDCQGTVRHSALTTGDKSSTGVLTPVSPGAASPQEGAVDAAFQSAVQNAVAAYATLPTDLAAQSALSMPDPQPSPTVTSKFLVVPIGQPGLSDPNAAAVTNAIFAQMKQRNLNVTLGAQIDDLTTFATAGQLCASNGVQGIIVPRLRFVQLPFSGQSVALLRLNLFACDGSTVAYASGRADLKRAPKHDFGAAIVQASQQAMASALDELFPSTKSASGV